MYNNTRRFRDMFGVRFGNGTHYDLLRIWNYEVYLRRKK